MRIPSLIPRRGETGRLRAGGGIRALPASAAVRQDRRGAPRGNAEGEILSAIIECSCDAWWYPGEGVVKSVKRGRAYPPDHPEETWVRYEMRSELVSITNMPADR